MNYPDDLRYARNHEWVRTDGSMVRMGISDYAQDALGDVVYVELPNVGTMVERGQAFSEVESTKSVSDVYAPVSGRIAEVNEALDANPELINSDPYGEGWFVVIEATDLSELDDLSNSADYEAGLA